MTPTDEVISRLRNAGCNPKQSRVGQWTAKCPNTSGHRNGDRHPSLSIADGTAGCVLHCATGCPPADVAAALGLRMHQLFDAPPDPTVEPRIAARHPYIDPEGTLLFEVVRWEPKRFQQRRPDGHGGWHWNLQGVDRPLYRLPAVLRAVRDGAPIWVVEGEKDADTLAALGLVATCNPMGAGKWRPEHTATLQRAALVNIVADNDTAGHDHAAAVAAALTPHTTVRLWHPPAGRRDITDHLNRGGTLDQLVEQPTGLETDDTQPGPGPSDLLSMLIDWDEFWRTDHDTEQWVAWPCLPEGRQVALYAPAKTGKSLFVFAVVVAVATGRPVLGNHAVERRHILYLDYEMTKSDVRERLEALGLGPDTDLSWLHYASLPSLPPLNTEPGAQALVELVNLTGSTVVIIDTTGRATEGDENDAGPYREFARLTGLALKRLGVTVLRTDHAGKEVLRGQRGSSAKNDDVDVVMRLDLAEDGWSLTRTHSRVGWVPEKVAIRKFEGDDGVLRVEAVRDMKMWPAGTKDAAAQLDRLGVPLDASRMAARAAGFVGRNALLGAALEWRRAAAQGAVKVPADDAW